MSHCIFFAYLRLSLPSRAQFREKEKRQLLLRMSCGSIRDFCSLGEVHWLSFDAESGLQKAEKHSAQIQKRSHSVRYSIIDRAGNFTYACKIGSYLFGGEFLLVSCCD
jgi:hypothetical protein